jgi:hypothetical protein
MNKSILPGGCYILVSGKIKAFHFSGSRGDKFLHRGNFAPVISQINGQND